MKILSNNDVAPAIGNTHAPLLGLSSELFALLIDFCELDELRPLSLTCKTLRRHTIDALRYRRVDLGVHNLGCINLTHWDGQIQWCRAHEYPPKSDVETLPRKQHSFLEKVLDRPYLGKMIHDFTWTTRSCCDPDDSTDAIYPDTHLWQVFKLLTNVTKLDFACFQTSWDWVYLRQPPDVLFPAVTDLRLSGLWYPVGLVA